MINSSFRADGGFQLSERLSGNELDLHARAYMIRVTTHLENLEKSGNSKVVREKSGKMEKVGEKSG